MVAHDGEGVAAFDHGADEVEDLSDLGAAVDVVAKEDDFSAVRMAETVAVPLIAEVLEEGEKLVVLAVDVADEVERGDVKGFHDASPSVSESTLLVLEMQDTQL